MPNPDFIIVGVARCATTSLFHYLSKHSEIELPRIKEPKFFTEVSKANPRNGLGDKLVGSQIVSDWNEYQGLFSKTKISGEASSDYFYYAEKVIPLILEKLGSQVKIIVSLRNPVERTISAYQNLTRDDREKGTIEEALDKEDLRINEGWDWMWHIKRGSLYAEKLKLWMESFDNVKVILYEDIKQNPNLVMRELFDFLGVADESLDFTNEIHYSPSAKIKSSLVSAVFSRKYKITSIFRDFIIKLVGRNNIENMAKSWTSPDDSQNLQVITDLANHFNDDVTSLSTLLERDLKHWNEHIDL